MRVYTCPPLYLSVLLAYWESLCLVATLLSRVPACQTGPRIITRSTDAAATWERAGPVKSPLSRPVQSPPLASCAVPPLALGSVLCGREEGDDGQSEGRVERATLDFFTYWLAVLREMAVGGGQRKERNYVSDVKRSSLEKSRPFFIIICWLKLNTIKFVICIFLLNLTISKG